MNNYQRKLCDHIAEAADRLPPDLKFLDRKEIQPELTRMLTQCKSCDQLYMYEFFEGWGYSDRNYKTFIPIESEEEYRDMLKLTVMDILNYKPRVMIDSGVLTIAK